MTLRLVAPDPSYHLSYVAALQELAREGNAHYLELVLPAEPGVPGSSYTLARLTDPAYWSTEDLGVLSNMIVTLAVGTTEAILSARPDAEDDIAQQARTQLRMVLVGALRWRSEELAGPGPTAVD